MTTDQQIKDKVEGRYHAAEIYDFAREEDDCKSDEWRKAFWLRLLEHVLQNVDESDKPTRVIEKGPLAAMTEDEAVVFECGRMPFGKHETLFVAAVPLGYLDWLDDQPDFRKQLDRYLRNERVMNTERDAREMSDE